MFDEFKKRGLIFQTTHGLDQILQKQISFYWGIDPTGDSLHVGHLFGLITFMRLIDAGHKGVLLIATATGMVGDPSGKNEERPILPKETIEQNAHKIKSQITKLLSNRQSNIIFTNNLDWLQNTSLIDFLRNTAKYIPLSSVLDKEFVKSRLGTKEGISFAETTYQLLQAVDFVEHYKRHNCLMQIGGSDQWGNMTQGVDLIRRKLNKEAHVLSWPLIVDPKTGRKFGKTEKGSAIWLDPQQTHPFALFQFFINIDDELISQLIRFYSFKSIEEIENLESRWHQDVSTRLLQKSLATEVVAMVHSQEIADKCLRTAEILFENSRDQFTPEQLLFLAQGIPTTQIGTQQDFDLDSSLVLLGLAQSKNEARRLTAQNGVTYNFLFDRFYLIKKGKKDYGLVLINS